MSTGLIVAIVVIAIVVVVGLLLVAMPRMRRRSAERRMQERRGAAAERHRGEAEEKRARAAMAEREAERARAEAGMHESRAELHERGMADDELAEARADDTGYARDRELVGEPPAEERTLARSRLRSGRRRTATAPSSPTAISSCLSANFCRSSCSPTSD